MSTVTASFQDFCSATSWHIIIENKGNSFNHNYVFPQEDLGRSCLFADRQKPPRRRASPPAGGRHHLMNFLDQRDRDYCIGTISSRWSKPINAARSKKISPLIEPSKLGATSPGPKYASQPFDC